MENIRVHCRNTLLSEAGEKNGSILSTILLGEKSQMDPEIKKLYQVNGIGHILAISGLHLSVIGIGIYQLLRKLTGSYTIGGIGGIFFFFLYVLMIGVTVSVIRAGIMYLFRVGAEIAGRHYDSVTALSVAAAVVLIWLLAQYLRRGVLAVIFCSICSGGYNASRTDGESKNKNRDRHSEKQRK
ncbi:MAG: ComEC/Rec2 family competence protein [Dorea formicigenerans]